MNFRSIKYRMMAWNTAMLAAAFIPFLLILNAAVNAMMLSSIDSRLESIACRQVDILRDGRRFHLKCNQPPPKRSKRPSVFLPPVIFSMSGEPLHIPGNPVWDVENDSLMSPVAPDKLAEAKEKPVFAFAELGSVCIRVLYIHVKIDDICGIMQVTLPATEFRELRGVMGRTALILIPVILIISVLGGWIITLQMMKPVRVIADSVSDINESDLSKRLDESGGDEFASLAVTINGMLSRLENAFKDIKRAFEREKQFTSDASHELRTPLTVIKANTSLALRVERDNGYYMKTIKDVDRSADAMLSIVESLLLIARAESGRSALRMDSVNVAEFVESIICLNFPEKKSRDIVSEISDSDMSVRGDINFLKRFIVNLIENAIRATGDDGRICVNAFRQGGMIKLSVSDNGCGIEEEHIPHLTERFYRIDKARNRSTGGSGLGLAICRTIAESHGGWIEIKSSAGKGTEVSGFFHSA